ncbi:MAG: DUF4115 domain-containing protein [Actinomycetota bacterium]|nr:DUF4115 domain-containing protein [Actinomycetota bacterium]
MQNESIGSILYETRIRLGKSVKEVELDTKIRAKYIDAMEHDDFMSLPGSVYAQGFLKVYANYLGLDPAPLVQLYKSTYLERNNYDMRKMPPKIRVKKKKRPRWFKLAVALGVIASIFVGLIVWGAVVQNMAKDRKIIVQNVKTRKTKPTVVASATTSTTEKRAQEQSSTNESSSPSGHRTDENSNLQQIKLKLTGTDGTGSWVRVTVDEEKKFEGLISDGTSRTFEGKSISIRVGNIAGLEILLNGKKVNKDDFEITNGIASKNFSVFSAESSNGQR